MLFQLLNVPPIFLFSMRHMVGSETNEASANSARLMPSLMRRSASDAGVAVSMPRLWQNEKSLQD